MTIKLFSTAIAGSLPKPAWLSEINKLWPQWKAEGEELKQAKADATLLWIKAQEDAGLDVIGDGEQSRQHFVHGFLEQVDGIDFDHKVKMGIRNNRYDAMVPQVVATLKLKGRVHAAEAQLLRAHTRKKIKFTLPGPMTIVDTVSDQFYGDKIKMAMAFAELLNQEALALQADGVDIIQFDEPAFNVYMKEAADWGVKALEVAAKGLSCTTAVHICYGYGIKANNDWKETLGQEWRQYEQVLPALAKSSIQQVSLECYHSHVPPHLMALLEGKDVMVGVIDVASDVIETPEQIADTIGKALQYVPRHRLLPCTNCGLAPMDRAIAIKKLQALAQGAALARERYGDHAPAGRIPMATALMKTPAHFSSLPFVRPAQVGLCGERSARLLTVLQLEIDRQRLPGAVVLVARHGKVALFESLGVQNPATGEAMTRDSIFRIYSMTKPVVSVAIMMLMEQGHLSLGDPVVKYLPEFASQHVAVLDAAGQSQTLRPVKRDATVHDLLRHTAGLTYEFMDSLPVHCQYAQARIGSRQRSNAEFSKALAALPLLADPGSVWEYSRATDVLGRLIEVLSGQTLAAFLHEKILSPLGMHETAFSVPAAKHGRIAEPYAHDPDGGIPMQLIDIRNEAALASGGGGLASTAMDYARFLQFMLNRGELDGVRLLGPHTVDFMTTDHLGNIPVNPVGASPIALPPGHGFGLGFAVRTATGLATVPGSEGLYYWGGIAGTTFFVDPVLDMFALMMIQAPNQREYFRPLFRNLVYAALLDQPNPI